VAMKIKRPVAGRSCVITRSKLETASVEKDPSRCQGKTGTNAPRRAIEIPGQIARDFFLQVSPILIDHSSAARRLGEQGVIDSQFAAKKLNLMIFVILLAMLLQRLGGSFHLDQCIARLG
jgi:hypothetical protein